MERPRLSRLLIALPLLLAGCLLPKVLEPTAGDRRVAVTIDTFAPWMEGLALVPQTEELTKQKVAWSHVLEYEYLGTARVDQTEFRVTLRSEITVHPNAVSARHNFDTYKTGLKSGIRNGGGSVEAAHASLEWGDEIDLFEIHRDGHQIGNGFIGRRGEVALYVLISGLYSSDSAMFEAILAPQLNALEHYDPSTDADLAAAD